MVRGVVWRSAPVFHKAMIRVVALLLSLGLAVAWATPAVAHAALVESHPADGAVLGEAPERFELRFNEPVAPLVLRLVSPDGQATELERHRADGATLVVGAPAIGQGTHALSWRVASEDGHPIGGTILFSVGAPSAAMPADSLATQSEPLRLAIWSAKLAIYLGLVLGIGGLCFGAAVAPLPRSARRISGLALLLGLAAAPLSLGLQGLDALAAPFTALADGDIWLAGLHTSYGGTTIAAAFAMAVALAALAIGAPVPAAALAVTALVAAGAALAASGHASAASPQLLMRPAVFLHVVCVILWAGTLLPLALIVRGDRPDGVAALRRFSRLIPFALLPLVASGVALAVVQLRHPGALWSTDYGRLFLAKSALLALLFALAAANRWRLTRPTMAGETAARRRLARSIAVEVLLVLAILGVVAGWRFTPPPRSLDDMAPRQVALHLHAGDAMAHLAITPARPGPVSVSIRLMSGDMTQLAAKEVMLVLASPELGIEPIRRPAVPAGGDGTWRVDDLVVPLAGSWTVRLDVLVSDFDQIRLDGGFTIAP